VLHDFLAGILLQQPVAHVAGRGKADGEDHQEHQIDFHQKFHRWTLGDIETKDSIPERIFLPVVFLDAKPCPTRDARRRAPPPASGIPDLSIATRSAPQILCANPVAFSATSERPHRKPHDRVWARCSCPQNAPAAKAAYPEMDAAWPPEKPHSAAPRH